jgi:hypothetical protein
MPSIILGSSADGGDEAFLSGHAAFLVFCGKYRIDIAPERFFLRISKHRLSRPMPSNDISVQIQEYASEIQRLFPH